MCHFIGMQEYLGMHFWKMIAKLNASAVLRLLLERGWITLHSPWPYQKRVVSNCWAFKLYNNKLELYIFTGLRGVMIFFNTTRNDQIKSVNPSITSNIWHLLQWEHWTEVLDYHHPKSFRPSSANHHSIFCFYISSVVLGSTYKWDHMVFVFLLNRWIFASLIDEKEYLNLVLICITLILRSCV